MSVDLILGALAALEFYGLTWYLVLKSKKIIENIDNRGPGHTEATQNGTENDGDK